MVTIPLLANLSILKIQISSIWSSQRFSKPNFQRFLALKIYESHNGASHHILSISTLAYFSLTKTYLSLRASKLYLSHTNNSKFRNLCRDKIKSEKLIVIIKSHLPESCPSKHYVINQKCFCVI